MQQQAIARRSVITLVLLSQFIPLALFPPSVFSPTSQEWWLPVLLAIMVFAADFALLVRRSPQVWPWHLILFAQGFNVISRLMMVWPHATVAVGKASAANVPYLSFTVVSLAWSAFILWYAELPAVRMGLLRNQ